MLNKLSEFKCLGFVTQSENEKHQVRHTRDCFKDNMKSFLYRLGECNLSSENTAPFALLQKQIH